MKFGVLTFGYDGFLNFPKQLEIDGYYDVNLGDNAQSIAVRRIYKQLGIDDMNIVEVNRDTLPEYAGGKTLLIMNGVFYRNSFPLPAGIIPVFIGFHAPENVIAEQQELLRRYQPIGCRDEITTARIRKLGIEAFTTGCLTLTLPNRADKPETPKLLVVYGSGAGYLPPMAIKKAPSRLLNNAELIYHRFHASKFPFDAEMRREAELYEQALFKKYCREATLVLTSLHHVATPCMAFGIPVIICRMRNDARFSMVEKLLPIYTPDKFDEIDWNPPAVDISRERTDLLRLAKDEITTALQKGSAVSR
ncbi:polysaccharide pyruvyl transferase [Mesorhizobium sp. J18]|uniref:polysaccharide pyruvyl transferase family protein n=1 Tax=Mesorhizobium sp. J18 TaxID=935263 RepID=UPI0011997E3B|nr:polysaccharide pyruvyl transferase family protein [Mesorhizobium sp. J18]TWG89432.1 polysaccharide pyruvyl transferase [Mesorhizobium sp. J18]